MTASDTKKRDSLVTRMTRELRVLRDLGFILEPTMSIDDVFTLLVERTTKLMQAERSTLFVIDSDGMLVSRVIEGEETTEIRLNPGQGIAGWVASHGRPLLVTNAYNDERFDPSWDGKTGFLTRCVLCHPLIGPRNEVIGVIEVLNKEEQGQFDDTDRRVLGLISEQLAILIENSRLVVDLVEKNRALLGARQLLHQKNQEIGLQLELERCVAEAADSDSLFAAIMKRTLETLHAEVCVLYKPDDTGAELRVLDDKGLVQKRVIRVNKGSTIFVGWVAKKGQELNLIDPALDPRFASQLQERIGIPVQNLAAVPLRSDPEAPTNGTLLVENKKTSDRFDENDMALLRLVANRLTQAMDHFTNREEKERERRLATVGRLMAGVLHDLKSPMSVISGYAELLAEMVGTPEGDEYFEHLSNAVNRITTMAEEIIAFSKGERDVLLARVSLDEFMKSFFRQIEPMLKRKDIILRSHVRTGGAISIDPNKMLRAFHNIVSNAIEAMGNHGTLIVEVDRLGNEVVFGFTDTGSGIPETIQGSLFQSFVTVGKGHGTGLGLAVAKEIIESHSGNISFSTIRGSGTTFLVSIPG